MQNAAAAPKPADRPAPVAKEKDKACTVENNRYRKLFSEIVITHVIGAEPYKRDGGRSVSQKIADVAVIAAGILPIRGKVAGVQQKGGKPVPEFNFMGTQHTNCILKPTDPALQAELKEFKRWLGQVLYMEYRAAHPPTAQNTMADTVTIDDFDIDFEHAKESK